MFEHSSDSSIFQCSVGKLSGIFCFLKYILVISVLYFQKSSFSLYDFITASPEYFAYNE